MVPRVKARASRLSPYSQIGRGVVERERVEELATPEQRAVRLGQLGFVADRGPLLTDGGDLAGGDRLRLLGR
jgi:hypothetical protein